MKVPAVKETLPPVSGEMTAALTLGPEDAPVHLVWGHGWGQDHRAFVPLAESLARIGGQAVRHTLVDFPGFGKSPAPPEGWGTAEYADAAADLLKTLPGRKIWIGHSFGCRVGLQLAARHPELTEGMVLIAAAGLKPKLPLTVRLWRKVRVYTFKTLKRLIPLGLVSAEKLYAKFGSADYRTAGKLRALFVRIVNEDLTGQARQVACPVLLVFGEKDTETPPEMGRRLAALIPRASLHILPGQDHYSVLGDARHQTAHLIAGFVENIK